MAYLKTKYGTPLWSGLYYHEETKAYVYDHGNCRVVIHPERDSFSTVTRLFGNKHPELEFLLVEMK